MGTPQSPSRWHLCNLWVRISWGPFYENCKQKPLDPVLLICGSVNIGQSLPLLVCSFLRVSGNSGYPETDYVAKDDLASTPQVLVILDVCQPPAGLLLKA